MDKGQTTNVFYNQEPLLKHEFSQSMLLRDVQAQNITVQMLVFTNCEQSPDPLEVDPERFRKIQNLLILDDCFLDKQIKADIPEDGLTIAILHSYPKIISDFLGKL